MIDMYCTGTHCSYDAKGKNFDVFKRLQLFFYCWNLFSDPGATVLYVIQQILQLLTVYL